MTTITIDWLPFIFCVLPILIALLLSLLWLWRTLKAGNAIASSLTRSDVATEFHSSARSSTYPNVKSDQSWGRLTRREREVALLAAAGKTNAQIGNELHITTSTVGNHL